MNAQELYAQKQQTRLVQDSALVVNNLSDAGNNSAQFEAEVDDVIVFNLSNGVATTGTTKDWIVYCPYAYTITNLILVCDTAPTGANLIADLNVNGSSILSTKISIDATETNSTTATTPYVLTTTSLALGAKLTVDIDQVGASVAGTNVQLYVYGTRDLAMIIRANKGSSLLWDFDVFNTSELAFWMSLSSSATRTSVISYGTNISGVTDVSGNARNLSQSTASAQPVYQGTGFNGLPTIAFDGVDDFLNFSVPQAYNQAVIAVVDTTNIGASDRIFINRSFTNGEPALYFGLSTGSYRPAIFWGDSRAPQSSPIQDKALFFWQLGGNASGLNRTNVNSNSLISEANTQSALSSWTIINSSFSSQQSNIKLSELVILNNPTQDTIDRAHGILAHRWWRLAGQSVPLPSGHPYYSNPSTR